MPAMSPDVLFCNCGHLTPNLRQLVSETIPTTNGWRYGGNRGGGRMNSGSTRSLSGEELEVLCMAIEQAESLDAAKGMALTAITVEWPSPMSD